jgi:ribose-phosphate pyrophosphokinase
MITLNLIDINESQIKYEISKFPDGQQTLNILTSPQLKKVVDDKYEVEIVSRLNDFKNLELILCATSALKNIGVQNIHLYTPYFIGARSDRKFVEGGVNYLKDIISPIINAQDYKSVTVLDPHSDVLEATLNNFKKVNNFNLVNFALEKIGDLEDVVLVSPDGGALKKIFDVAKSFNIPTMINAIKHRDIKTGQITHTEVPDFNFKNNKFVIIDDICDGGRTFVELAKVIKEKRPTAEIYLVVTHGIFSAGFNTLNDYFNGIFSTNSYSDVKDDNLSTYDVFQ